MNSNSWTQAVTKYYNIVLYLSFAIFGVAFIDMIVQNPLIYKVCILHCSVDTGDIFCGDWVTKSSVVKGNNIEAKMSD